MKKYSMSFSGNKNIYNLINKKSMQSPKYSLNQEDGIKIIRVFAWLLLSTTVSFLLTILPQIDFQNFAFLVPIINILLVSAEKFIKDR